MTSVSVGDADIFDDQGRYKTIIDLVLGAREGGFRFFCMEGIKGTSLIAHYLN